MGSAEEKSDSEKIDWEAPDAELARGALEEPEFGENILASWARGFEKLSEILKSKSRLTDISLSHRYWYAIAAIFKKLSWLSQ